MPANRRRPALLLKARPTPAQLADRLRPPPPDGLELYLDVADISGPDWLGRLQSAWQTMRLPERSVVLVEGPIRSLDGCYFDLTRDAAADHELIARLVSAAQALSAEAINVHCIAPRGDPTAVAEAARGTAKRQAVPFLRTYVAACAARGVQPLIENLPPVGRMREGAFVYTPIGVEPQDLAWFTTAVPGLGLTLDTSHAQLYINAATGRVADDERESPLLAIAAAYAQRPHPTHLLDYVDRVEPAIVSAHISNARGLLGEGLPYGDGDADLNSVVRALAQRARYLVTEPLEPDSEHAVLMRDCWRRMQAALAAGNAE